MNYFGTATVSLQLFSAVPYLGREWAECRDAVLVSPSRRVCKVMSGVQEILDLLCICKRPVAEQRPQYLLLFRMSLSVF